MRLSFLVRALLAYILLSAGASTARADALVYPESVSYGHVVKITNDKILFQVGCTTLKEIDRNSVKRVDYNKSCKAQPIKPFSAGGTVCDKPQNLYVVRLRRGGVVYASNYSQAANRIHLVSADESEYQHLPRDEVSSITRQLVCEATDAPLPPLPNSCVEPRQWAANFSFDPVYANRILTRGIAVYLEDDKGQPISTDSPLAKTVRDAFGASLTLWMGALQDNSKALPPEALGPLNQMISRTGNGYQLLTPPQVILAGCRDSANFVVRYVTQSETAFYGAHGDGPMAARAQVEGRTVLLNGFRYKCWRSSYKAELFVGFDTVAQQNCLNLVPFLVHEVGHALGLAGHVDLAEHPSVMDSVLQPNALRPSNGDAGDLIKVLLQPIEGAAMDRLDADRRGVRLDPAFSPETRARVHKDTAERARPKPHRHKRRHRH